MNDRKNQATNIGEAGGVEDDVADDAVIGVALRWSLKVVIAVIVIAGSAFYLLKNGPAEEPIVERELAPALTRRVSNIEIPEVPFRDITSESGIVFRHENGSYGQKLLPETMGGGCAFFDCDNDGDQDILFVNSKRWSWDPRMADQEPATMALYLNDGSGNFVDATTGSGLDREFYGMGAAIGDYDNDGRGDVFISAVGRNSLFHNEGGGRFVEVTENAGVAGTDDDWSTSCGWFDYDRDGDLDLFVCNYVKWSREYDEAQNFKLTGGGRAFGRPQNFEGAFPMMYRNDGEGRFVDVSESAGVQIRNQSTGVPLAKSLGVVFADFDGDGWLDILVANDTVQNLLFHNRQNGTFEEVGGLTGVAFDQNGFARGAMGIDAARFRNNGSVGVAIGNFSSEMTALYVSSRQQMQFTDEAVSTGLGPWTRQYLTFGVVYLDFDLDGRLDLFCSNGHLEDDINRVLSSQHYEQPQQLFWNCGASEDTEFLPVPEAKCGADLIRPMVGRGVACADIDEDGDQDLLVTAAGGHPRLLRNDQKTGHNWLRLKLVGSTDNRDAIGARVIVRIAGQTFEREVAATRGYLSQSELPVTIGLGSATSVDELRIVWPSGTEQIVAEPTINRLMKIEQLPDPQR